MHTITYREWPYRHIQGWDVAQAVAHLPVKVRIIWSILDGGCICRLGYFPIQPVVHNWSIKGCGMCSPVCEKVHMKDPLLLIGKSSLYGDSRFHLKKYVTVTICLTSNNLWYDNQCSLEASLNKTNFLFCIYIQSVGLTTIKLPTHAYLSLWRLIWWVSAA